MHLEGYFTDAPVVLSLASSYGTAAQPLRFTSWSSTSMATIAHPTSNGFRIYSHGVAPLGLGIQIDHLIFRGGNRVPTNGVATSGIFVDYQPKSPAMVDTLIINDVDISGYMYGIFVFRAAPAGFIRNVVIRNSAIHGNVEGTTSDGRGGYSYINRSGSGIFLSGVQYALIESVIAFDNGGSSQQSPVGIGIRDSDAVIIRNSTSQSVTGSIGGFELSAGTTNSLIEMCHSDQNGGFGYSIVSQLDANLNNGGNSSNITIQDSTSVGDGTSSSNHPLHSLGVMGLGGAVSSNVHFQNMNVTTSADDPPFSHYGNQSTQTGFVGLYLSGSYNRIITNMVDFLFPSAISYSCNLSCASASSPSVCACA